MLIVNRNIEVGRNSELIDLLFEIYIFDYVAYLSFCFSFSSLFVSFIYVNSKHSNNLYIIIVYVAKVAQIRSILFHLNFFSFQLSIGMQKLCSVFSHEHPKSLFLLRLEIEPHKFMECYRETFLLPFLHKNLVGHNVVYHRCVLLHIWL